MSSFLSELGGITAGVGAEGLAFAAGFAAGHALHPEATLIAQDAWHGAQLLRLDPTTAAEAAAENYAAYGDMQNEATYSGLDSTRFAYLYDVTLTGPGMGELLTMIRRKTIKGADFAHGLRKAKFESRWDAALADLANVYIGIGDIATAIVRGAVPAPSWVPVAPPTTTDRVPRFPVTNIDPIKLAAKLGYSEDMLRIMTARSGLSLAPILATQANFRGVLTDNDWLLAIAEGDLRTEWADTLREASRQILTAGEYTELELRGWYDTATRRKNTAKHGMSDADSDLLFKVLGRPMNHRQVFQAERRGGVYDGPLTDIEPAFLKSLRESNIRPEWYNLEWFYRFTQPGFFAIRQWIKDGHDPAWARTKLMYEGWEVGDIDKVITAYAPSGTATATDQHVTKAATQLWTQTHKSYIEGKTPQADVTAALTALAIDPASQTQIIDYWNLERGLIRKELTAKQIVKALGSGLVNPATGAPWTTPDAEAAIMQLGYDQADAQTLIQE